MSLDLKKFSMKNISFSPTENNGPVIVLIGRRDTGKSFLVRDLLYYQQSIPIGTVISGTEEGNGFYSSHVPKLFIHDEYNTGIIENVLKRQKQVIKEAEKIKREITNFLLENKIKDPNDPVETQERSALRQKKVDVSQMQLDEQISCWKDCALLKKELREKQRELDEKEERLIMFSKILEK